MGDFDRQRLPDEAPAPVTSCEPSSPQIPAQNQYGNAFLQQQVRGGSPNVCRPGNEAAENTERDRQAAERAQRAQQVASADERLRTEQQNSVNAFRGHIYNPADRQHPGVIENGTDDRGTEIDAWNREAGVAQGSMWCGSSTGHAYREGTRGGFRDNLRVASDNRARNYFLYRQDHEEAPRGGETPQAREARMRRNAAMDQREAQTQAEHTAAGSNRRYMTYRPGQQERGPVEGGGRPEVYNDPSRMPVRPGDTVVFSHRWRQGAERDNDHGHIAMVASGPDRDGHIEIVEGNAGGTSGSNRVQTRRVNIRSEHIDGFGRPALGDMTRGR